MTETTTWYNQQVFIVSDGANTALQRATNAALYKALAKNAVDRFDICNEFITAIGVIVWVSRGGLRRANLWTRSRQPPVHRGGGRRG